MATGPSEKVKCPKCGKVVPARGLPGHVRWSHGKGNPGNDMPRNAEKAVMAAAKAGDKSDKQLMKSARDLSLIESDLRGAAAQLLEIRKLKRELADGGDEAAGKDGVELIEKRLNDKVAELSKELKSNGKKESGLGLAGALALLAGLVIVFLGAGKGTSGATPSGGSSAGGSWL